MRIIAGRLGGRHFVSPPGHKTHPMSDKMRGALFNVLGDISGLTVLDALAGSGALAYEALSRGAGAATLIDHDRNAQRTIEDNIASLDLSARARLIKASAGAWLSTTAETFDIVLLDPPYQDVQLPLLKKLAQRAKPGGVVVLSLPPAVQPELPADYEPLAVKSYGDSQLVFYRRIA